MRIWSRLDRAVAGELKGPLALGVAGFSLVMLLNFLFVMARRTIEKRVPVELVIGFVLSELPRILMFTIPMGVLLAVLIGIGRMATQSELVALRAGTVSPARIFRPVLVLALAMAAFGIVCANVLMPIGWAHTRALWLQIIRVQDLNREIDPGVFYDRLPGAVLYARGVAESAQGRIFRGILLFREAPDGKSVDLLVARRGRGDFDLDNGRRSVLLDEGEWHTVEPADPGLYRQVDFKQCTLPFPADASFAAFASANLDDPRAMGAAALARHYIDLRQQRATATDRGSRLALDARIRRAALEGHRRLSLPLAAVALALAAFPLAARTRRGGRFAGLSQALLIILVFWVALSTGWALSEQGKWPVWLGPWLPVMLSLVWAAVLWMRLSGAETGARRTLAVFVADIWRILAPRPRRAAENGSNPRRSYRRFGFGRLDVFLGTSFLKMFVAVLFVLLVIAMALGFKDAIDEVDPQAARFPWGPVLRFVGLTMATQLRFMVPIAALFGAAIALAALGRTGEITALKAAGIGPPRIALTLVAVASTVAVVYTAAQETILPTARREAERTLDRIRGKAAGPELLESGRRWLMGEDGRVWNYIDWDARRQVLIAPDVSRIDFDNARLLERIEAAQVQRVPEGWRFTNGWRRTFEDNFGSYQKFSSYLATIQESPDLFGEARSRLMLGDALADQLTFVRLWRNLRQSERTGYPAAPLVVGLNEKFVFPLLPLAFVTLAVALGAAGWQRRGGLHGFGIAILIVFAFWLLHAIATSLGREAIVNPTIATWVPIAIVFAAGGGLLARAR